MDPTRRQFGTWLGAGLVLGSQAVAGVPKQPKLPRQAVGPVPDAPPTPDSAELAAALKAVTLKAALDTLDEGGAHVSLELHNPGKTGLMAQIDLVGWGVVRDAKGERHEAMAWLNDEHPLSRRLVMPSFVDLPPEKVLLVGTLHAVLPDELSREGAVLEATLRLTTQGGSMHQLPVSIPLDQVPSS